MSVDRQSTKRSHTLMSDNKEQIEYLRRAAADPDVANGEQLLRIAERMKIDDPIEYLRALANDPDVANREEYAKEAEKLEQEQAADACGTLPQSSGALCRSTSLLNHGC